MDIGQRPRMVGATGWRLAPQRTAVSSYTFRSRFVQTMKGAAVCRIFSGGPRIPDIARQRLEGDWTEGDWTLARRSPG